MSEKTKPQGRIDIFSKLFSRIPPIPKEIKIGTIGGSTTHRSSGGANLGETIIIDDPNPPPLSVSTSKRIHAAIKSNDASTVVRLAEEQLKQK
jgi:hypothetical protein